MTERVKTRRSSKHWTHIESRRLRAMVESGAETPDIADELGRTVRSIRYKAQMMGLPLRHAKPEPPPWKGNDASPPISRFAAILREVSDKYQIPIPLLIGPSRQRRVAWPRQEVMHRGYKETRLSTPQIGARLGGRDHTTVIYGIRAHAVRQGAVQHR